MVLLRAEGIRKQYGGVAALKGASLELRAGECHALVGENGAGKSTLARVLAGAAAADAGRIFLAGQQVRVRTPLDAQRLGIAMIHQELDLFPSLTLGENIVVGNLHFAEGMAVSRARIAGFCRPFLRDVGLDVAPERAAGELPIAQQQLLVIARALSMDARVLLMDEPTSALFHDGAERLFGLIAALRSRGVAIVYVSHKMEEIFRVCDRATVLRDGETVGTVGIAETAPREIIRMMIGREVEIGTRQRRSVGEVVLHATGLLRGVSFQLHRGEVLGIAGLVGSGRSALGLALQQRYGVALVPEDRRAQGLMMQMSVTENAMLAVLGSVSCGGLLQRREERERFAPVAERLALRAPSYDAPVSALSGDNQQKVLLARWLLANRDVLFLDDPARGIDVGAKQDIYRMIDELAAEGKGIVLVSSELPELLRLSDRILVLHEGRAVATVDGERATQESIMAAATAPEVGA